MEQCLGKSWPSAWDYREVVNIAFISLVPAKPSVAEEKIVEPEPPSTSKNVTEEELEDWLDSMIS